MHITADKDQIEAAIDIYIKRETNDSKLITNAVLDFLDFTTDVKILVNLEDLQNSRFFIHYTFFVMSFLQSTFHPLK